MKKYLRVLPLLCVAGFTLAAGAAQAALLGDGFFGEAQPPLERALGHGHSALWTLSDVAVQYQPMQLTPVLQAALQAQNETRFLEALIALDDALKSGASGDAAAEINLLRASFVLQGDQYDQALEILTPLLGDARHAADAHALVGMVHLQQGRVREALETAQHARELGDGMLPHLVHSYALQGEGRLKEAHEVMHGFNARAPHQAVALAREAELALTLGRIEAARTLVHRAQAADAANFYVIAVSGLTHLIDGYAKEAKAAFETALKRDTGDAKALFGLGLAEIKLGNFQAGQKKLQAAHEADPKNALILTYLGRAQQQAGQLDAAKANWKRAQQADPQDPAPWLYQAQAALQDNRPLEAQGSLREAQARTAKRAVYRGKNLLNEDEQQLQANLAETQRRLGQEDLAFHTLDDPVGEKSAATLRNQADLLQGRRFGESARRSLLLQSLFNERPGALPAQLDIYGDGAGQTGAGTPQHGAISELNTQQVSYNNYDALFGQSLMLEADSINSNQNTNGEQVRFGIGNGVLGMGIAQRQFKTDGFAPLEKLDNRVDQAIVQWRPFESTQVFASRQTFYSQRSEVFYPTVPWGLNDVIKDRSLVTRLGLRHSLSENSELRALWSTQHTGQTNDYQMIFVPFAFSSNTSSEAHGAELQYRHNGAGYAMQWGVQQFHGQLIVPASTMDYTKNAQQLYAAWQQTLNPQWQLDAGLGWGWIDNRDNLKTFSDTSTYIARWMPRLGVLFTPDEATHVRAVAWEGMGMPAVGDATLTPTSTAGTLLNRYGDDGFLVQATHLSVDRKLGQDWMLSAAMQQRNRKLPFFDNATLHQQYSVDRVEETGMKLQWQPEGRRWAASLALDCERILNDPGSVLALDSVYEQNLYAQQLEMRWFASEKWTARLSWSHNRITGTQKSFDPFFSPILLPYQDDFNQVDAKLDWQFLRLGSLAAGVKNAANRRPLYMDIDRLNPRFSNGRLVYARIKIAW